MRQSPTLHLTRRDHAQIAIAFAMSLASVAIAFTRIAIEIGAFQ